MSDDDPNKKDKEETPKPSKESLKGDWSGESIPVLFKPDEMDIYVNKATKEAFIFHGKKIDYESLDHLEYDASDHSVDVVKKDGTRIDLGVKIQWLVRPHFTKAEEIFVVRTENKKSIDGTTLPLVHKEQKT